MNTFFSQQISQTRILDSNLITRQYKLDMMARFMEIKAMNPRITQKEKAKNLDTQLLVYNVIDMIKTSFRPIKVQLIVIKKNKRF